ncbi:MAG: hypothetical protein AAF737_00600 [Pseudomonadota bacterium]
MKTSSLTLKSALIGAGLAIGATLGATGTANADSVRFGFSIGDRGGSHFSAQFGDRIHHRDRFRHDRRFRDHRRACTPRRAVRKARHMGIRHAQLRRYGPRGAVVIGRYHGERVRVKLNRNCRVQRIAYR